jgi:inward rectifier potassium channel
MQDRNYDPGFTRIYDGALRRTINRDGSFNVHRVGVRLKDFHMYQFLVRLSWPAFIAILVGGYVAMNTVFAFLYLLAGAEHLLGASTQTTWDAFLSAFFFSTHTFTTVGYGNITPEGFADNMIASLEAMTGLLSFAIATGLLFGRFSRATAKLVFSNTMVIAPHKGGKALMFRLANRRRSTLMEVEARLLLMTVVDSANGPTRKYDVLELEVPAIHFLPLSWTVVHPITNSSPFHNKTAADLGRLQAEVLVLIKGFDDTFQQIVHARYSYRHDEIMREQRFTTAFHVSTEGKMVLDLDRISETQPAPGEVTSAR